MGSGALEDSGHQGERLSPDFGDLRGGAGWRTSAEAGQVRWRTEVNDNFMTSMPDFAHRLIRIASEGDYVAAELVGTGTSTGPANLPERDPIPPTGRHVEFAMAGFFRVTPKGKIAEERCYYDRLDLLQQLNPPAQS